MGSLKLRSARRSRPDRSADPRNTDVAAQDMPDGYFTSRSERLSTPAYALTHEGVDVSRTPDWLVERLGTVRVRVTADPGRELFVGVAEDGFVRQYLHGVGHDQVVLEGEHRPDLVGHRLAGPPLVLVGLAGPQQVRIVVRNEDGTENGTKPGEAEPSFIFAIAVWDRRDRSLHLFRDHFGAITGVSGVVLIAMGSLLFAGELTRLNGEALTLMERLGINFFGEL